ncbi:hypothetical protein SJAV_20160 [Sulfurisphaera javensis]|uniref:Clan AA aspartic protease n=1 Tax=Sulfurisphaera javensis TaxID=2049879 RepID=A0AAT9GT25_9CREN
MALVLNCFRINNRPEVEVELIDPVKEISEKIKAIIDTGFSGWVLVPGSIYSRLASLELAEDNWRTYSTLSGNIKMRTAKCIIKIGDVRIMGYIESPTFGREMTLLEREVLKKLKVEIKKGEEICIEDP